MSPVPISYAWVERDNVGRSKVSCLRKKHDGRDRASNQTTTPPHSHKKYITKLDKKRIQLQVV